MNAWRYQNLNYWKRLAKLDPMPAFLLDFGELMPGQVPEDFVDSRYFSPLALHWEEQVLEYLADGDHLKGSDGELLARIGRARRFGHSPSAAQVKQFQQAMQYHAIHRRMPEALQIEMAGRGIPYGPDHEPEDDLVIPSAAEAVFRLVAAEQGKDPKTVKARFYAWRSDYEAIFGTS